MKTLRRMAGGIAAITLLALGGCVGAVAEGANIAKDKATVSNNIEAARAGDAEAQYKVGDALCCSLNEGEGFYDTPHSVAWLCSAAAQRHGPASLKLGEIYAGDTISGARLLRRAARGLAGSSTNMTVAYAWLRRADFLGVEAAREPANEIWSGLNAAERGDAEAMATGQKELPCEWSAVIAGG
ncbi:MAG TPA: hypothetical protein VIR38_01440 [Thalassobaculum sp.]